MPWPIPTTRVCGSPAFMRAIDASRAAAAWVAWSAVQTDWVCPSGPMPSVASNRSLGPVALMRKS